VIFTYLAFSMNIELISNKNGISSFSFLFMIGFLQIWPPVYLFLYFQREKIIYDIGLNDDFFKQIRNEIRIKDIEEKLLYAEEATSLFTIGRSLTSLIMISNFFENVLNSLHRERAGFGKKAKELELNVTDEISGYTLEKFYYKIRSRYVHEVKERGLIPTLNEMKITFRLLKKFLESLAQKAFINQS